MRTPIEPIGSAVPECRRSGRRYAKVLEMACADRYAAGLRPSDRTFSPHRHVEPGAGRNAMCRHDVDVRLLVVLSPIVSVAARPSLISLTADGAVLILAVGRARSAAAWTGTPFRIGTMTWPVRSMCHACTHGTHASRYAPRHPSGVVSRCRVRRPHRRCGPARNRAEFGCRRWWGHRRIGRRSARTRSQRRHRRGLPPDRRGNPLRGSGSYSARLP